VNGYVEAGYAVTLATLALYAGWVGRRRRALNRAVGGGGADRYTAEHR